MTVNRLGISGPITLVSRRLGGSVQLDRYYMRLNPSSDPPFLDLAPQYPSDRRIAIMISRIGNRVLVNVSGVSGVDESCNTRIADDVVQLSKKVNELIRPVIDALNRYDKDHGVVFKYDVVVSFDDPWLVINLDRCEARTTDALEDISRQIDEVVEATKNVVGRLATSISAALALLKLASYIAMNWATTLPAYIKARHPFGRRLHVLEGGCAALFYNAVRLAIREFAGKLQLSADGLAHADADILIDAGGRKVSAWLTLHLASNYGIVTVSRDGHKLPIRLVTGAKDGQCGGMCLYYAYSIVQRETMGEWNVTAVEVHNPDSYDGRKIGIEWLGDISVVEKSGDSYVELDVSTSDEAIYRIDLRTGRLHVSLPVHVEYKCGGVEDYDHATVSVDMDMQLIGTMHN